MTGPIAAVPEVSVAGIFPGGNTTIEAVPLEIYSMEMKKWPYQSGLGCTLKPSFGRHPAQTRDPGAPADVGEHRLHLVVCGVSGGDGV